MRYIILDLFFPDNPKIITDDKGAPLILDSYEHALMYAVKSTIRYKIVQI